MASTTGEQRSITVMSIRLADVDVIEQTDTTHVIDSSIHVQGRWGESSESASYVVALGDDPAGQAFHAALRSAVAAAKRS